MTFLKVLTWDISIFMTVVVGILLWNYEYNINLFVVEGGKVLFEEIMIGCAIFLVLSLFVWRTNLRYRVRRRFE